MSSMLLKIWPSFFLETLVNIYFKTVTARCEVQYGADLSAVTVVPKVVVVALLLS